MPMLMQMKVKDHNIHENIIDDNYKIDPLGQIDKIDKKDNILKIFLLIFFILLFMFT